MRGLTARRPQREDSPLALAPIRSAGQDHRRSRNPSPPANVSSLSSRHPAVESTRNRKNLFLFLFVRLEMSSERRFRGRQMFTELNCPFNQPALFCLKMQQQLLFSPQSKRQGAREEADVCLISMLTRQTQQRWTVQPESQQKHSALWKISHAKLWNSLIFAWRHGSQLELQLPETRSENLCDQS